MECSFNTRTTLGAIGFRLVHQIGENRTPLSGGLELTERCNLNCVHCYINTHARDLNSKSSELDTRKWISIIDKIADEGCLFLQITGGEPLLRPDFKEIYKHSVRRGLLVNFFTNGTLISKEIADTLAEYSPLNVEISIYGSNAKVYEDVTRFPGSFSRCIQGIELLLERKIPLYLKTMVIKNNHHDLENMKALAKSLGVPFSFDAVINKRIDGGNEPTHCRLPVEKAVEITMADEQKVEQLQNFCERFISTKEDAVNLYQCMAGKRTFFIDSRGNLCPCIMARKNSFSLQTGTWEEGWNYHIDKEISRLWKTESPCRRCDLLSLCSHCPGTAANEGKGEEDVVEYFCQMTKILAEKLAISQEEQ